MRSRSASGARLLNASRRCGSAGRARSRGRACRCGCAERSGDAPQPVAVRAVVGAVRAQVAREREVTARLVTAPGLLERAAEAEVGEVVDGRALHDRAELLARLGVAARSEVRAPECL